MQYIKERASSLENIQFLSERQGGRARPLRSNKANWNLISKNIRFLLLITGKKFFILSTYELGGLNLHVDLELGQADV